MVLGSLNPESQFMLTPSEVLEHLFCPRFTYFMQCLRISQQEHKRYKVMKGRKMHEKRSRDNPGFKRKRVGCVKRLTDVYLASPDRHVRGMVDEILELEDGSLAPLDYKMSPSREKPFKTHQIQLILYGLLIAETYNRPVKRGFIVYTVGGNHVSTVEFTNRDFAKVRKIMAEITEIIDKGFLPRRTSCQSRCLDCCYRNICV